MNKDTLELQIGSVHYSVGEPVISANLRMMRELREFAQATADLEKSGDTLDATIVIAEKAIDFFCGVIPGAKEDRAALELASLPQLFRAFEALQEYIMRPFVNETSPGPVKETPPKRKRVRRKAGKSS